MIKSLILKNKKAIFIIGFLLIFINVSGLNGVYNLYNRFIITGTLNFILTYYLLKINPFKKFGLILIFIYFFVALPPVIIGLINSQKMPGILSFGIYIISSVFAIIVFYSSLKIIFTSIYIILFSLLIINHNDIINHYYALFEDNKLINKPMPLIKIFDSNGKISFIKANGKIQMIDLWTNSCGYCIKAFPKFEKLKDDFKNDPQVIFFSVNVKLKDFKEERAKKFLKGYSFKNYFTDSIILKQLNFSVFPNYILIDKNGKIKYFGDLHTEKDETFNNIYDIIKNEKLHN